MDSSDKQSSDAQKQKQCISADFLTHQVTGTMGTIAQQGQPNKEDVFRASNMVAEQTQIKRPKVDTKLPGYSHCRFQGAAFPSKGMSPVDPSAITPTQMGVNPAYVMRTAEDPGTPTPTQGDYTDRHRHEVQISHARHVLSRRHTMGNFAKHAFTAQGRINGVPFTGRNAPPPLQGHDWPAARVGSNQYDTRNNSGMASGSYEGEKYQVEKGKKKRSHTQMGESPNGTL